MTPTPPPFEIGIVMAGAISAGAYTAGVMDFLVEALDEWEKAKSDARTHPGTPKANEVPQHEVRIRVMTGSSAGGMTAAMTAPLVRRPHSVLRAKLYENWVSTIDIVPLLGRDDLGAPVTSVLDSTVIATIAGRAYDFDRTAPGVPRPFFADPLHVILTTSNLLGVPYSPEFANWKTSRIGPPPTSRYQMITHTDSLHFVLSDTPPPPSEGVWLEPGGYSNPDSWGLMQHAAMATGAFPIGLAPRRIRRQASDYDRRQWPVPGPISTAAGQHACEGWETIAPTWPTVAAAAAKDPKYRYEYLAVDGGVMNNEPLDHARRILFGPGEETTAGDKVGKAILMVLPFPTDSEFGADIPADPGLLGLLPVTFNALISQSRFKPQEVAMANDPNICSRFLILPRRGFINGKPDPNTIACGSLGGFGGFLEKDFRHHDYELGRRNAQWFLQQYFVLPKNNKLFDGIHADAVKKHEVHKAGRSSGEQGKVMNYLPIIPLMGKVSMKEDPKHEVPALPWPKLSEERFTKVQRLLARRLGDLVSALSHEHAGTFSGGLLRMAWQWKRNAAVKKIADYVREDLRERKLI